jgi:XRE family transcriptional regulator, fatty acid utilization regulator
MIGEEVKRRREEMKLTGAQLAERAGMAPSAVSQIETGKRTPSSASVIKLAAALGVEVGDLYPKGQPRLPDSLAIEDILERAGTKTRWGALSDDTWNARLGELSAAEAMQLYEQVQAERLATLELRHQLAREGTPTEKLFAARMWERYLVRTLRAAEAAGNELVIEEAFDGARRELVGASA